MAKTGEQELLRKGREALGAGAWAKARRAFEQALSNRVSPEGLEGLGMSAWWLDDAAVVFEAREQSYALYRRRKDDRAAARVAIAIADDYLYFRGEPAVTQGWYKRARDLLSKHRRVEEQGWLEFGEGDMALTLGHDPKEVRRLATKARSIGKALGIEQLEMVAQALGGAALVALGEVSEGMQELAGAATTALSGELSDRIAISYACCYLLSSCERARDFDRAAQWCERVEVFAQRIESNALLGTCRTRYAQLLIGRGKWAEAERELTAAARNYGRSRPVLQGEPLIVLVGLRRRQGRFEEASALLDELEGHPLALLERAALALEQGDADPAANAADRYLRALPERSKLDRLAGLEVLLRARLAAGELPVAREVLEQMGASIDRPTNAVRGAVRCAEGLVAGAAGQHDESRRALEDAVDLLHKGGALFEAARARLDLARRLDAQGRRSAASAEARAALRAFQRFGAAREAERAEAVLKVPATPVVKGRAARTDGLSRRELQVLRLIAQGLSNARVAKQLVVSEFTVKRHVQNILGKLVLPSRAAAAAYAVRQGLG